MLTERQILREWIPLLLIWFLMALDLAIASALVARDPNPEVNLAAFNITFGLSLLLEAPIIMMLVVPLKIVEGRHSFFLLRKFCYGLNLLLTSLMLLLLVPVIFDFWSVQLLNLDSKVSSLVYRCLWFFLPWAGIIGYRRFHQGLMVKVRDNRRIVYGTLVRLCCLGIFSTLFFQLSSLKVQKLFFEYELGCYC